MYTFVSEGGTSTDQSNFHPLYITDSKSGGREANSPAHSKIVKLSMLVTRMGFPLEVGYSIVY